MRLLNQRGNILEEERQQKTHARRRRRVLFEVIQLAESTMSANDYLQYFKLKIISWIELDLDYLGFLNVRPRFCKDISYVIMFGERIVCDALRDAYKKREENDKIFG